jgi:uncharacterized protein (DUF302 family)
VDKENYGLAISLDSTFEEALQLVRDAFKKEGFGTLTEIDIKSTLHQKLGVEIPPYTILGMCNPELAHRAIMLEPEIGVLLPCNVLVRSAGDRRVEVVAQNPALFSQFSETPGLDAVASDARQRIDRALEHLAQSVLA